MRAPRLRVGELIRQGAARLGAADHRRHEDGWCEHPTAPVTEDPDRTFHDAVVSTSAAVLAPIAVRRYRRTRATCPRSALDPGRGSARVERSKAPDPGRSRRIVPVAPRCATGRCGRAGSPATGHRVRFTSPVPRLTPPLPGLAGCEALHADQLSHVW